MTSIFVKIYLSTSDLLKYKHFYRRYGLKNSLPIQTSLDDVSSITNYLKNKVTGASLTECKKTLGSSLLDPRKITAYTSWGFVLREGEILKLSEQGRQFLRSDNNGKSDIYKDVLNSISVYWQTLEWMYHQKFDDVTNVEIAVHWHENFSNEIGTTAERTIKDMAIPFFRLCEGAEIGILKVGRRKSPTRFEINKDALSNLINFDDLSSSTNNEIESEETLETYSNESPKTENFTDSVGSENSDSVNISRSIFIGHGKNKKPLEQIKKFLSTFSIPFKVCEQEANLGRPIPQKVKETIDQCGSAILIFTKDSEYFDKDGNSIWKPSENVIHELGATSYKFADRIVVFKEDGIDLPSNFDSIGYIMSL